MTKKEIREELKSLKESGNFDEVEPDGFMVDEPYMSMFLGSYMYLDPCGRYHHFLSPNGFTRNCERFWENMESVAEELGMWIESGEGDPTDIFLCMPKN